MRVNIWVKLFELLFMKPLKELVRTNVLNMQVSDNDSRVRTESCVWLDRDENPYNSPYNRYPDSSMAVLKASIAKIKNVQTANVFIANGRYALVDSMYRCFCTPGVDNVVIVEPTYDVYRTMAELNCVENRSVLLDADFQLNADRVLEQCDEKTKLIWLCSPNTPTGIAANPAEVEVLLEMFDGIVVVDESYVDFSSQLSWRTRLGKFDNLVVLNTMDNSWGCAAIGVAMLYASSELVNMLNRVALPFGLNSLSQKVAIDQLRDTFEAEKRVRFIILERQRMISAFMDLSICVQVYPSETNFLLVKFEDAQAVYKYLLDKGIVVKNCADMPLCENGLLQGLGNGIDGAHAHAGGVTAGDLESDHLGDGLDTMLSGIVAVHDHHIGGGVGGLRGGGSGDLAAVLSGHEAGLQAGHLLHGGLQGAVHLVK